MQNKEVLHLVSDAQKIQKLQTLDFAVDQSAAAKNVQQHKLLTPRFVGALLSLSLYLSFSSSLSLSLSLPFCKNVQ